MMRLAKNWKTWRRLPVSVQAQLIKTSYISKKCENLLLGSNSSGIFLKHEMKWNTI